MPKIKQGALFIEKSTIKSIKTPEVKIVEEVEKRGKDTYLKFKNSDNWQNRKKYIPVKTGLERSLEFHKDKRNEIKLKLEKLTQDYNIHENKLVEISAITQKIFLSKILGLDIEYNENM